ncbi:MAG: hypothetical protein M1484_00345 [Patescibacteria group bacterium]|nr:hypothetical protein [Patescibacteria group bacterium]MCL5431530.1 hypothetical protein [Patescibacteria group bacterium]
MRHAVDFLILLLIISLGLGGVLFFRFDIASQVAVVILMAVFYVFWGIVHHHHDGNLTSSIVLEYIGMAALVTFILIIFLLRV